MSNTGVGLDTRFVKVIKIGAVLGEEEIVRLNKAISRAVIDKQTGIVYDCFNLIEITSGQAAIFLSLLAAVRDQGLDQAIANLRDPAKRIFELSGIVQAVPAFGSVGEAACALGE